MNEYRIESKLNELETGLNDIRYGVQSISHKVMSSEELWDNSDVMSKWHVSQRTLASWRARQIIGYVKIGKKIYYSKEDRDRFLSIHHVNNGDHERGN